MKKSHPILISILGVIAAPLLPSQSPALVSLTRSTTATVVQQEIANCRVASRCSPQGFPAVSAREAGGTAYDPRTGGVWISDGKMLAKVDPDTCDYQCRPVPAPVPNNAFVTGLAMQESRNRLWLVDSVGGLTSLQIVGCQIGAATRCRISIPLGQDMAFSGLALDEANGLLIYSASNFAGTSISQAIYVARTQDPCNPICNTRITNCIGSTTRFGGVTGLAFDPCTSKLWATDGNQIVVADFRFSPLGGCSLSNFRCCGGPTAVLVGAAGLALRPGGSHSVGRSCSNNACGSCPNMEHTLGGDPSIGNPAFAFNLHGAPVNSRAWLAINAGTCQSPGLTIPPFCGPIRVPRQPIPPVVVGPFPTGGMAGTNCTGEVSVHVPIPLDRALCGNPFASQFLILCFNPIGVGTGVSNCREFTINGT